VEKHPLATEYLTAT